MTNLMLRCPLDTDMMIFVIEDGLLARSDVYDEKILVSVHMAARLITL